MTAMTGYDKEDLRLLWRCYQVVMPLAEQQEAANCPETLDGNPASAAGTSSCGCISHCTLGAAGEQGGSRE